MRNFKEIKDLKILYLSSFPPRECGIADFCQNTIASIHKINPNIDQKIIAVNEPRAPKREYPARVKWELSQEDLDSYQKTAFWINESGADILFLMHEYGLFGGFDGIFVLKLLEKINVPIVSFLHSIPVLKEAKKRRFRLKILKEISNESRFLITTSFVGKNVLKNECKIPKEKIFVLRHGGYGIPFPEKKEREKLKEKYGFKERFLIIIYGFITKSKGIDYGIEAIRKIKKKYPKILFLILGTPHPLHVKLTEKEYYQSLVEKVKNLRLEENVSFIKRFIPEEELIDYLKMGDIFLLPYKTRTQISSGVLSNAMTTGNCIVSTPFIYAKELLKQNRGFFIEFENSDSIAKIILDLIKNPKKIEETRKRAYLFGRNFTWEKMAASLIKIFLKILPQS